jgi:hypothetical protein
MNMRVQTAEGSDGFTSVDVETGTCNCGQRKCIHLDIATDVVRERGRRWRWLILSSFHKELRRGDMVAARHWACWMAHCDGKDAPLEYMRKIWSEETADLDLAVWLHADDATVGGGVARFCAATKVWELQEWWTCFETWQERRKGVGHESLGGLADLLARPAPGADGLLIEGLRADALKELVGAGRLTLAQAEVFRTRYQSRRFENEDFVLAQLLSAQLTAPSRRFTADVDVQVDGSWTDGSTLLLPPPYAYDYHSYFGKARMRSWLERNPGVGFGFGVDTSPVDLRWAGGLVPLFWRVQAWQNGGTPAMHVLAWHELEVKPEALRRFTAWCGWWPEVAVR